MKFTAMRALITGASSGIGRAVAVELHRRGATVLLVGRDAAGLAGTVDALGGHSGRVQSCIADLVDTDGRTAVAECAVEFRCNVLVNNAGLGEFALVDEQTDVGVERLFAINALAPMQLTRALLPRLRQETAAVVLNVGSVFGSLAYPGFAAYSASKFALRGFTEALRRELADTGIRILYLAPRATRTGLNQSAVERMNHELGVAMDPPELVARAACDLLERGNGSSVLGWPERLFVQINALLPRLVDNSLRKQLPIIRRHAQVAAAERALMTKGVP